ncbi:MAG TPA: adenosylmethionine--8-amino-7-oxononanoate transaminase [Verrucomicrobiae bacterium]|jgi:adenosylmethionine-8-amino-7-oxononanoate aminotransferase|nr:adenosylmethionine--8-amino-7-oxononanoate transaminase [Verrucomicrobiae bacterium]
MNRIAHLDHKYVWHPFTQMRDWMQCEPTVIVSAKGAVLRDLRGRNYLDANSSIWTNLHGHSHPKINAAISRQLKKIAHSSALGLANEPASLLAEKLVRAANQQSRPGLPRRSLAKAGPRLEKVFFSDDGSTALEVALKLAYEFSRRIKKLKQPKFLSLAGAYHGDTVGAVSLGHIDLFHKSYADLLFKTDRAMAPYCYRCPFNRAKPERADAREYRKCNWECVSKTEKQFSAQKKKGNPYAAFVFEPLMQGAAGMIPQPAGWLNRVAGIARSHGALLVADEVMTGFGRTGAARDGAGNWFACRHENVQPDFLCLAKGLTGGYLPMAATLTTRHVFEAFLGKYEEFKSFFHGHSFTGNQLGAAAALANFELLGKSNQARKRLEDDLRCELQSLWQLPNVGDVRQVGLVAGVELVKNWRTREPFDLRKRAGIRVCEAMASRGVLTRPIGNVIVLMPPYCTTKAQLKRMVSVLRQSIDCHR